jgi:hypothetical protein
MGYNPCLGSKSLFGLVYYVKNSIINPFGGVKTPVWGPNPEFRPQLEGYNPFGSPK